MDTWGEDPCGVYPAGVPLAPSGLEDTDWTPTTTMESTGVPEYKAYQLAGQRIEGVNMKNAPVNYRDLSNDFFNFSTINISQKA